MDAVLREELLAFCGIETQFNDAWGKPVTVTEHNQLELIRVQGFATDNDELAREQLLQRQLAFWQRPVQHVSVQRQADSVLVQLQVDLSLAAETAVLLIDTEQGTQHKMQLQPVEGELLQVTQLDGIEYHQYQHALPLSLESGYHNLTLQLAGTNTMQSLIITPGVCYTPDVFSHKKQWGIALQLYALRSERNWGIGDFTDLANTLDYLAGVGADFVGLNPIHALYPAMPDNASPYSPSSRRWLNTLYIDVTTMPGFNQCQTTRALVDNTGFSNSLEQLRQQPFVDYAGVSALKMPVMQSLYQWYTGQKHADPQFEQFVQQGGESLYLCALYDALHRYLYQQDSANWVWPVWPAGYQNPYSEQVQQFAEDHQHEIGFFCYLQFIAQQQLAKAQQLAKSKGMTLGLYRDLAVGVSEASTEIWGNPTLYCRDASVGAPPDPLGPAGQNWGLPPMYPYQLYCQAYQPFIDLLRANMRDAGALRIDHVMALLRLWWVPKSAVNAGGGAYVYYPIDDLLGILALESQRNKAVVIGEDLGTVPDGIRELLHAYAVYSYRVFFFETAADGGFISPKHYPVQAMATLTTHDLPTLTGFWHCEDLRLGKDVGLYQDEAQLQQLYQQRHQNKQRILDSLHGHQVLPQDYSRSSEHLGMDQTLNYAMQRHLAAGSSQLLCLQLEDALQMSQPVNIPGTSNEYPNWRRKLSENIEQWRNNPAIKQLFNDITAVRQQ